MLWISSRHDSRAVSILRFIRFYPKLLTVACCKCDSAACYFADDLLAAVGIQVRADSMMYSWRIRNLRNWGDCKSQARVYCVRPS